MIAVVNTGGANLRSVTNAFSRLGADCLLTDDPKLISTAERVVLPGVGAALDSMQRLNNAGLVPVLKGLKQPILGICLGMQLLFESSAEGDVECLGLIPGRVVRLRESPGIRVPHMGWNHLAKRDPAEPLLADIGEADCFYFVHSYQAPEGPHVKGWCDHGGLVPAVVAKGHVWGVQFHPEKSQEAGAKLLRSFLNL